MDALRSDFPPAPMAAPACSSCGSANVQRQRIAWEMGDSSIQATTAGVGRGLFVAGSSGTQVSDLARKIAPPSLAPTEFAAGAAALGLVIAFGASPVFGGLLTALFLYVSVLFYRQNRDRYPLRLARYEKEWICLGCGHRWLVD